MPPILAMAPLWRPVQFPGQWVITKRRAIMRFSSTDYLARFNISNLLQVLTTELQKRRDNSGTEIDSLFAKTEAMCGENNIPCQLERERKRTKRVPAHLRDSVIHETIGHVNDINAGTKDMFSTDVYLAIIDCLLNELNSWFPLMPLQS